MPAVNGIHADGQTAFGRRGVPSPSPQWLIPGGVEINDDNRVNLLSEVHCVVIGSRGELHAAERENVPLPPSARGENVEPDPALRSGMLHSRFAIVISSFAVTSSTLEKGTPSSCRQHSQRSLRSSAPADSSQACSRPPWRSYSIGAGSGVGVAEGVGSPGRLRRGEGVPKVPASALSSGVGAATRTFPAAPPQRAARVPRWSAAPQ